MARNRAKVEKQSRVQLGGQESLGKRGPGNRWTLVGFPPSRDLPVEIIVL